MMRRKWRIRIIYLRNSQNLKSCLVDEKWRKIEYFDLKPLIWPKIEVLVRLFDFGNSKHFMAYLNHQIAEIWEFKSCRKKKEFFGIKRRIFDTKENKYLEVLGPMLQFFQNSKPLKCEYLILDPRLGARSHSVLNVAHNS